MVVDRLFIASLLALALVGAALAQQPDPQAELAAAFAAAKGVARPGPAEVRLGDHAVLKLPDGVVYVPPAEGGRIMVAMGNTAGNGLLGLVFPTDEADWMVVMRYVDAGYIRDDDARDWNAAELLDNLKRGTEEINRERVRRGIPELELLGWIEAPRYDAATHRLVWSASSKAKSDPGAVPRGVNYNTYALGRQGYISLNLVTEFATIERDKPAAHQLLAALEFDPGKRYADFNASTDRVAEYGLAALVGGIAAKKLGLFAMIAAFFAKFAKVIGVAAIALVAGLAKFLGRKKGGDAPPA
jgi:uncharacterized membrane-anchored protein